MEPGVEAIEISELRQLLPGGKQGVLRCLGPIRFAAEDGLDGLLRQGLARRLISVGWAAGCMVAPIPYAGMMRRGRLAIVVTRDPGRCFGAESGSA